MKDNFGGDIISLSDEDGNNYELEHVDTIEIDGIFYLAFLPVDIDIDDENYGLVLLKKDEEDDEYLSNLTDEEEDFVYEKFMERLFNDDEDDYEEFEEYEVNSDDESEDEDMIK